MKTKNITFEKSVSQEKSISNINLFLNKKNKLFSSVVEETVTNKQVLLITHAVLSGSILCCSIFSNLFIVIICLVWFIASLLSCKKGGLK